MSSRLLLVGCRETVECLLEGDEVVVAEGCTQRVVGSIVSGQSWWPEFDLRASAQQQLHDAGARRSIDKR